MPDPWVLEMARNTKEKKVRTESHRGSCPSPTREQPGKYEQWSTTSQDSSPGNTRNGPTLSKGAAWEIQTAPSVSMVG